MIIGTLEVYWRDGSWRRPDEWVFECYRHEGCLILEAGCVSFTLHKRTCDDMGEGKLRWFEKVDYAREKLTKENKP